MSNSNPYIPEGGLWTAEDRKGHISYCSIGNPAECSLCAADATVSALIAALEDCLTGHEMNGIKLKGDDNARALLSALKG